MATDMHLKEHDIADPPARGRNGPKRSCVDCHTTMTPCWRGGPAGPRTLCNACGIRYRKRRAFLDLKQGVSKRSNNMKKTGASGRGRVAAQMKQLGLMGFKGGSVLQQQHEEWKRNMGEEERAAILLMALSSGSNIFVPVSI